MTNTIEGQMLPSSSPASEAFVVKRFVNMSTAMIDPPNRYSSTIWNAPRTISGNEQSISSPGRFSATASSR